MSGLPLLSGPPPPQQQSDSCRKCGKEFNLFFLRSRKCNYCAYMYCHNCSDYQALMPRQGTEAGYDVMSVCAYCIEYLTITAGGRSHLKSLAIGKLRKYANAYNINIDRAVEKDDIIEALMTIRMQNGCLPPANENFFRKHSIPASEQRQAGLRNIFRAPPSAPPSNTAPSRSEQQRHSTFARPDLAPDLPSQHTRPPQPPPRPQQHPHQYQGHYGPPPHPPPRPHSGYEYPTQQQFHDTPPPSNYGGWGHGLQQQGYHDPNYGSYRANGGGGPPPLPPHASRPSAASSSQQAGPPPPPPRARSSSERAQQQQRQHAPPARTSTPAPPPPTLDTLLTMPASAISALSIGALKSVLFTNHVSAGQVLEKEELVRKVLGLVEEERGERERQRRVFEREEMERVQTERGTESFEEDADEEEEDAEGGNEAEAEQMPRIHIINLGPAGSDDDGDEEEEEGHERGSRSSRSATADVVVDPSSSSSSSSSRNATADKDRHRKTTSASSSNTAKRGSTPKPKRSSPPLPEASLQERSGLCVVCQDEEANIAIVDCGHLAMCRGCSELVMTSSRECPLCRTRIVTESRLLRIFKT